MAKKPTMNDGLVRWTMQEARKLTADPAWSGDSERMNKPLEVLASVISSPSNPTKPVPSVEPRRPLHPERTKRPSVTQLSRQSVLCVPILRFSFFSFSHLVCE